MDTGIANAGTSDYDHVWLHMTIGGREEGYLVAWSIEEKGLTFTDSDETSFEVQEPPVLTINGVFLRNCYVPLTAEEHAETLRRLHDYVSRKYDPFDEALYEVCEYEDEPEQEID